MINLATVEVQKVSAFNYHKMVVVLFAPPILIKRELFLIITLHLSMQIKSLQLIFLSKKEKSMEKISILQLKLIHLTHRIIVIGILKIQTLNLQMNILVDFSGHLMLKVTMHYQINPNYFYI